MSNIALNMANIFCTLDDYDSALDCYRKAINTGLESKEYDAVLTSLSNALSLIYAVPNGSVRDLKTEIDPIRKIHFPSFPMREYTFSLLSGVEASERKDYAAAERHFKASLNQIKTDLTPERFRQLSLGMLANLEYKKGDYAKSLEYLNQSLSESDEPDIRAALYAQLRRCYDLLGNKEKAMYYFDRYISLTDTLLRSGQAKALRDIEMQNSTAEFNRRMDRANDRQHSLVIVICVIFAALVGMVVLGIRLWVSRNKLQRANEELYRQARAKIIPPASALEATEESADIAPDEEAALAERLRGIMESSPEIYHSDFTLDSLARIADAPARKVSQAINSRFGLNFSTFLQKYRMEEACRRLDDRERYGRQTIEAISEGLGFKSRSNFVAVFKKFTGLTPSVYQKIGASRSDELKNTN